jgi:hypothetical protein
LGHDQDPGRSVATLEAFEDLARQTAEEIDHQNPRKWILMKLRLCDRVHGPRGGCSPPSRRTHRPGARLPRSRRGRNRTPAWSRPACAGTAARCTGCVAARAVSAAAPTPAARWTPRPGCPGRAVRLGCAGSPSPDSGATSARSAPRAGYQLAAGHRAEDRSTANGPAADATATASRESPADSSSPVWAAGVPGRRSPPDPPSPAWAGVLAPQYRNSWRKISNSASFDAADRASSDSHPAKRTNIAYSIRTVTNT